MNFCSECGQGNPDGAVSCVQCGSSLRPGPEAATAVEPGEPGAAAGGEAPSAAGAIEDGSRDEAPGAQAPPPPPGPWLQHGMPPPPGSGAPFQPGLPPPPFAQAPPGYVPVPLRQTEGMAVASLVLGISGFFFCPLIMGILAVVFGYMGKRKISESGGAVGGDSFCLAGIILGFIQLGLTLVFVAIWIILAAVATSSSAMAPALLCLGLLGLA